MPSQRIFLIHIQLSCVHTEPVYYGILIEHHRAPFPPLFNSLAHTNMLGCKSCFGDQAICMHLPYPPPAFLFFTLPSRESEPDEDTGSAASLLFSGISDVLPVSMWERGFYNVPLQGSLHMQPPYRTVLMKVFSTDHPKRVDRLCVTCQRLLHS